MGVARGCESLFAGAVRRDRGEVVDAVVENECFARPTDHAGRAGVVHPEHVRFLEPSRRSLDEDRSEQVVEQVRHAEPRPHGSTFGAVSVRTRWAARRGRPTSLRAARGARRRITSTRSRGRNGEVSTKRTSCPRSAARRMICCRFVGSSASQGDCERQTIEKRSHDRRVLSQRPFGAAAAEREVTRRGVPRPRLAQDAAALERALDRVDDANDLDPELSVRVEARRRPRTARQKSSISSSSGSDVSRRGETMSPMR